MIGSVRHARFITAAALIALIVALPACGNDSSQSPLEIFQRSPAEPAEEGRITARPVRTPKGEPRTGLHALEVAEDVLAYVPSGYREGTPTPLVLMLHGAGGCAERGLGPFIAHAENEGIILVAPSSRGRTWDVILNDFGPDVDLIDRALKEVFAQYTIDPQRLAVEGFSDGASYALSLGRTNGDLFSHIIAFSPGFMAPGETRGKPPIFISHGVDDGVLPIDVTSRKLVPALERAGHSVSYIEFDGGHTPPPEIARDALRWFLDRDVPGGERGQRPRSGAC